MCNRSILDGGRLEFAPNCYTTQEECNKFVDNYAHALEMIDTRPKK